MRGTIALPVKIMKQIFPMRSSWRAMTVSTPSRNEKNEHEKAGAMLNDKVEPIVAFSRPPPQPPVLAPLLGFLVLEMESDASEN